MSFDRFTTAAQAIANAAGNEVHSRQHVEIEVEHVLWAMMQQADGIAQLVLQELGTDRDQLTQQLDQALIKLPKDPNFPHSASAMAITARVVKMIQRAEELASLKPDLQIDTSHLLQAICEETDGVSAQILHSVGVTPERLRGVLLKLRTPEQADAPQIVTHSTADWEQRIEQQLTRIETEMAAIHSLLNRLNNNNPE